MHEVDSTRADDARRTLELVVEAIEHEYETRHAVDVAYQASGPSRHTLERALWLLDAHETLEGAQRDRARAVLALARDRFEPAV